LIERTALEWLARYGAPTLFFAQVFGLFGLPIPDELLLTLAGALMRKGQLNVPATVSAALAGAVCGMTLSYGLGRAVGVTVLRSRLHLNERAVARAVRWFQRFGGWLLAFGYFVPGVRHITAILAGSAPLDYPTFARYAYFGGVLWCSLFLGLGYYAGDEWRRVAPFARAHLPIAAIVVASALALYLAARRRARSE
jgi:membrane protein DedA with SNARE-associated domain